MKLDGQQLRAVADVLDTLARWQHDGVRMEDPQLFIDGYPISLHNTGYTFVWKVS